MNLGMCTGMGNAFVSSGSSMTTVLKDNESQDQYLETLAAQRGDDDAFARLVQRHEQSL